MTLQELYAAIGGDYDRAISILRVEKLVDKHIRKLPNNGVVDALLDAGKKGDEQQMFERAHAMKGVCANLGLVGLADAASVIAEEYRPGNPRTLSDEEVAAKLQEISDMYANTVERIREYEAA